MIKIGLTLVSVVLCSLFSFSQLKSGVVKFDVKFSGEGTKSKEYKELIEGSYMKMYFYNDFSRVDFSMGSIVSIKTVSRQKEDDFMLLMEIPMMSEKVGMKLSISEYEKEKKLVPVLKIKLVKGSKKILAYKCKKAIGTDAEGNTSIIWYTEDIEINKKGQSYLNADIPGFPLQFSTKEDGITISMTATVIEKEILEAEVEKLFNTKIPEGYKIQTLKEIGL